MMLVFITDSEDSGIYSANLIGAESFMYERSWFDTDGEDFSYTSRVILEILETEHVYVNDLHQIITVTIHIHTLSILKRNNNFSDIFDLRRGCGGGWLHFSFLRSLITNPQC